MWIKTDSGELVNLEHYQKLHIINGGVVYGGAETIGKLVLYGISHDCCDDANIAICETREEAERIRDNIFYCIAQGKVAVDVADLRDVDLEKQEDDLHICPYPERTHACKIEAIKQDLRAWAQDD